MIIISNRFLVKMITLNLASAITIFPFILLSNEKLKKDTVLLNHEKIHIKQQLELLIIPFYIWYTIEFLFMYLKYKSWNLAYLNISFEREAYHNEKNMQYIKSRRIWAFLDYM